MNSYLKAQIDDEYFSAHFKEKLSHPKIEPQTYYRSVATDPFFHVLLALRHHVKATSDEYFSEQIHAKNIDLFLMTSSVSSPSGPGSDSEPIPITFGGIDTYLVDSSQFGFEPIVQGGTPHAYCYLASMRGENPDKRHLNQFYHCEYEGQQSFEKTVQVAEGYIKALSGLIQAMPHVARTLSKNETGTHNALEEILTRDTFERIAFDEAIALLEDHGALDSIRENEHGKDITSSGERTLLKLLNAKAPVWVTGYYRDRVPFYQAPDPKNPDRAINGDLLFPSILEESFGGEILGMGERQNNVDEMYASLQRQGVDPAPYEWYIDLRRLPNYKTSSGFGLGIERYIAWALGIDDIANCILYPRKKGIIMNP